MSSPFFALAMAPATMLPMMMTPMTTTPTMMTPTMTMTPTTMATTTMTITTMTPTMMLQMTLPATTPGERTLATMMTPGAIITSTMTTLAMTTPAKMNPAMMTTVVVSPAPFNHTTVQAAATNHVMTTSAAVSPATMSLMLVPNVLPYLKGSYVDAVGIEETLRGRSCNLHKICGCVVNLNTVLCFHAESINIEGSKEMAIVVYWVTDGIDHCCVGFLHCHCVKHFAKFHGKLAQVVEMFALSQNSTDHCKSYMNRGMCHAILIDEVPFNKDNSNGKKHKLDDVWNDGNPYAHA